VECLAALGHASRKQRAPNVPEKKLDELNKKEIKTTYGYKKENRSIQRRLFHLQGDNWPRQAASRPSHEVVIHDMQKSEVASKAKRHGVRSVPAVVIDGKLAGCWAGRGPDEHVLRSALA
jgi:glutaredoxin